VRNCENISRAEGAFLVAIGPGSTMGSAPGSRVKSRAPDFMHSESKNGLTSTNEVINSPVSISVFVCLSAGLCEVSSNFHKTL